MAPDRSSVGVVARAGVPALRRAAEEAGRRVPALCPRIKLDVGTVDNQDQDRHLGVGSLSQVLDGLGALADLGAEYVVLDSCSGSDDHREAGDHWWMLEAVAFRATTGT
jgi:hypothetical protein